MEELLGRQVPHSETAEQAVIGSMLIDTRCIPDVIERLRSAEFYGRQNIRYGLRHVLLRPDHRPRNDT